MKYKNLNLVLTDGCTAACESCALSCSPEKDRVMNPELMAGIIREAAATGINRLSFSGGEPFLHTDLMEEGIRIARENGMQVNIATNGFWGAWDNERIQAVLDRLKPDKMSFTYDFFHRKSIPPDDFLRAYAASINYVKIPVVYVADFKGEYSAGRFIQSMDFRKYGIYFIPYPACRCGRAENLPEEIFLTGDGRDRNDCLYDNTLSVLFNGDVYPGDRPQGYTSSQKMGNVCEKTLGEILTASDVPGGVKEHAE